MQKIISFLLLAALSIPALAQEDPYLWLEEIESPKAIEWAVAQNSATLAVLGSDSRYEKFKKQAEDLLQDKERIPYGDLRGGYVHNFWQDAKHVRGIWRRAALKEYRKKNPRWETILDLDALAKAEEENWVRGGESCLPPEFSMSQETRNRGLPALPPEYTLCMVHLSRGGKDAAVTREFDMSRKAFVPNGFYIPEAKSDTAWVDRDTLIVGSDFGPGTLTDSGYPRTLRLWKRGTSLKDAPVVLEGQAADVGAWPISYFRPEGKAVILDRQITFYEAEYWVLTPGGSKTLLPVPRDAQINGLFENHLVFSLRSSWTVSGRGYPQGALIALSLNSVQGEEPEVSLLYAPDERSAVQSVSITRSRVLVSVLNNVKGEILAGVPVPGGGWKVEPLPFPKGGTLEIRSVDAFSDDVMASFEDFLTPESLYWHSPDAAEPEAVKTLPARFKAKGFLSEQYEAKSKDGTRIPYFVIRGKSLEFNGKNPALLYGYGGFEYALTPFYSPIMGKLWLENGGTYVLANIRGGNEFGPRWHKAALLENRQRAYDDFIAVAEDLIRRGITSPRHLGIMGGSNGGLLVGATFVQRPDLFNAVVCQVPLLDMLRYHKLLAGASWMAEYGDPDSDKMRPALTTYSPYQNVRRDVKYPVVFIHTSTKDDRVHPGHARKMTAKMQDMGHQVLYFENIEGGHKAAANLLQRARRSALEYVYLHQRLND